MTDTKTSPAAGPAARTRPSLIPARLYTTEALYLPRVILIGSTVAAAGLIVALRHRPGIVSGSDLIATALLCLGLTLVGFAIRPDEGLRNQYLRPTRPVRSTKVERPNLTLVTSTSTSNSASTATGSMDAGSGDDQPAA